MAPPSLVGLRIAAGVGLVVSAVCVVFAFLVAWWLGLVAVAMVPALPMGFVLAYEAVRGPR